MAPKNRFFLIWLLLNPTGFTLGNLFGATDYGLIPSLIPGLAGLILGDLVFGGIVGFVQYLVFRVTKYLPASSLWIIATSLGFTLGARTGSLLTYRITQDWTLAGIIFGVFMGGIIGLVTALTLYKQFSLNRILVWIITSVTAWVAGEWIAFASLFSLKTIPLVAVAIAGITGLGLIYIQSQPQVEILVQAKQ